MKVFEWTIRIDKGSNGLSDKQSSLFLQEVIDEREKKFCNIGTGKVKVFEWTITLDKSRKCLQVTNTLAYFPRRSVTKEKKVL